MSLTQNLKEELRAVLLKAGCAAVGFARAQRVGEEYADAFRKWVSNGNHASMTYLERNSDLRFDPQKLLPGAVTIISVAVPYLPALKRADNAPQAALYAAGKDYHKHVVKLLRPVCHRISQKFGEQTRICVDSAPIAERYWALKAGIGFRGRNGLIFVPGYGSYLFLAEILTTLTVEPDENSTAMCSDCGACMSACPGRAIRHDGTIDARKCLSYLTIEHRGDYSPAQNEILKSKAGRNTIYGCDICQKVCPHNQEVKTSSIEAFRPCELWLNIDWNIISKSTPEDWERLTRASAMRRADFETLRYRLLNFSDSDSV